MIVLLPVSKGPSFQDALRLAVDVAAAGGGEIRIVYPMDRKEIHRVEEGGGVAAIHLAQHAAEEVEKRMMEEGTEAILEATGVCAKAGVSAHGEIRDGDPHDELLAAAGGCDLVVAAAASHFSPELDDKPGRLILSLLRDGGIPVLLACTPYRPVGTVVAGCGGGIRSERAIGAMTRLSLWKEGCRVILLAVDDSPESGEMKLAAARNLMTDAGYSPWQERVIPGPRPGAFLAFCEKENADAVVLGGWGEHRWDDLLGMSVTSRLVEEGRRNLFLYM
ncbi:MAG: universal stress protein [Thermodesulfobacteriota bacterium]